MEDQQTSPQALIGKLCARSRAGSSNSGELDARLLAAVKQQCRQGGDQTALAAWHAALSQLRAPHAQVRLHALLLCDQLFSRSRAFRGALLAQLHEFLELTVGHRAERPLPPPQQAAASLRDKALELLARWDKEHGGRHKQLPLAVHYLRDTLQLRLPDIAPRAAAAAAERAAREERSRAQLRQRLAALLGGEWGEGAAVARQLLREMQRCFEILDEQAAAAAAAAAGAELERRRERAAREAEAAAAAADLAGLQWEDVAGAGAEDAAAAAPAAEGLSAYAAADADDAAAGDSGAGAAADGSLQAAAGAGEQEAVLEVLAGLHRQLTHRTLPAVQDWLSVLGRAEPEGPAQDVAQQRALRGATELRGLLAAARDRCDAMALDLHALLLRRQHREQAAQEAAETAAETAAVRAVFGDSGSDSGSDSDDAAAARQGGAAAAGGRRQQGRQRRRQPSASDEAFIRGGGAYSRIVDPTLPRPLPAVSPAKQQQQQQQPAKEREGAAAARPLCPPPASSLPEDVRRKLAAQAPVLPTGLHTQFWDSAAVPQFVSGHGLEVSNHWGPVDVHQELPAERVEHLFMIQMPQAAAPATAAPRQAGQQPAAQQAPAQQQRRRPRERQQEQQQEQQRQRQDSQQQQQQQHPASQQQQPSAALQPWPSRLVGGADGAAASSDGRAAKRTRRAEERAYNEAVISAAATNEALARQLQDGEAAAEAGGRGRGRGGRGVGGRGGRGGGSRMGVRSRLASKLLGKSAVSAAVAEASRADVEAIRDRTAAQW